MTDTSRISPSVNPLLFSLFSQLNNNGSPPPPPPTEKYIVTNPTGFYIITDAGDFIVTQPGS